MRPRTMMAAARASIDKKKSDKKAGERDRTPDLRITNALLYQLSYASVNLECIIYQMGVKSTNRGGISLLSIY